MKKLSAIFCAVVLAVMMVVPASAIMLGDGTSLPDEVRLESGSFYISQDYEDNKENFPNYTYLLATTASSYRLYRCKDGFYVDNDVYSSETGEELCVISVSSYETFKLSDDGSYWVEHGSFTGTDKVTRPAHYFIWASDDLNYSDGSTFIAGDPNFPLPLWAEVERVTQGEMQTMVPILGGQMTTLVLCGVGCLALLMVLKLFGKRSLIFRS